MTDAVSHGWTITELTDRLELKPQTISNWIRSGLVRPDQMRRGRPGYVVGFLGLMELATVAELREAGFSTRQIKDAVENLRRMSGADRPLASLTLVVRGRDIAWRTPEQIPAEISALRKPGQRLMLFPIGERCEAVRRQLEAEERREGDRVEVPA
jgi:DNA-binding transcriptional MerR regulator